jgi:hypothetical protein
MGCAAAANFCSRVVFIRNVFNTFCCCNVGCNRDINICTFIKKIDLQKKIYGKPYRAFAKLSWSDHDVYSHSAVAYNILLFT